MSAKILDLNGKFRMEDLSNVGFQATELGNAYKLLCKMISEKPECKIFLTFTANMVASGIRGCITKLCSKKFADVVITTAGALEHDFIKCYADYELIENSISDEKLHKEGYNRIWNIKISNKCYEIFEEKIWKIFKKRKKFIPSTLAEEMGKFLIEDENANKKNSFLVSCYKNKIPIFCPGITDGAIGLNAYFYKQENKEFEIEVTEDLKKLADIILNAEKTAALILGGGISKHHCIGANILREGLDYAVYISTSMPFDGSLSGARAEEAISWSKLAEKANYANVVCDVSIVLPFIVKQLEEDKLL